MRVPGVFKHKGYMYAYRTPRMFLPVRAPGGRVLGFKRVQTRRNTPYTRGIHVGL